MKTKSLAITAIVLWTISISVVGFFFIKGTTTMSPDGRTAVHLTGPEKNYVLTEMRSLVAGVNKIFIALGENNLDEVAKISSSLGMVMATDDQPELLLKLPVQLKTWGMGLHREFDVLAGEIKGGLTQQQTLVRLGKMTSSCVACHATYRLVEDK
jgi:hypothetical protein